MAKIIIDHDRARTRHSEVVEEMLKAFARKMRRSKLQSPRPEDITWAYDYGVRLDSRKRGSLEGISVSLVAQLGRRCERHPMFKPGQPTPMHLIPEEIVAQRTAQLDPRRIPHICEFEMVGLNGRQERHLALGGYEHPDGRIRVLAASFQAAAKRDVAHPTILKLYPKVVSIPGVLAQTAQARYEAAEEGGEFTFERKTYRKLTAEEVRHHVEDKVLELATRELDRVLTK